MTDELVALLMRNGFVAPEEEAAELRAASRGNLDELVARRLTGEPLAWITGSVEFCGRTLRIAPGVYVPRWHTESVAWRAVERMPRGGRGLDLCTGSGAIAAVLMAERDARMVATDLDPKCVACARVNGVDAHVADLFEGVEGPFDVVTAVVPYVPTADLPLLQRDTFTFETPLAYDGGADGLDLARRAVEGARRVLRPGGALVLELGGRQPETLALDGFTDIRTIRDEEGDPRGLEATASTPSPTRQ
ncbi:peptide chain release factor N(5)-glutamine methyltransferase [Solirubrobacter sp. CPCC 204708]|uniref:Peptide chain release factor N(5)-glutamine methyltransferase n=1 Tax=Solirubrobacter deserti TaxID=2282478 RepID=A0ABT4RGK9_9ACTN|nr:HemK/PrmC family methyltransferase [Solirubrobacter deserti]MBE2319604.1 peptide chain release factor N(5)-glutamine methyltransferase [Solirubrobacter deserti]MDA0137657.1 peptide chain release factor N(5)-glutamine methyltransferase [Solirubrobacter deserti]